ncbi:MAG: aminomethyl-transferring glycine dehydrogenase subunit GcvPA [Candidatus Omnitrophica bacterium]|nr:aminomethyl-transferring glycine dehydrogenase subunit GcvPA [Candidatus Omnitrophota bacterium]
MTMHYQPMTEEDKRQMLVEIGVSSFNDLISKIPKSLRNPKMQIPEGLSEIEIQRLLKEFGSKNATSKDYLSFMGGGSYEHFIPAAVAQITGRQEFYTAYTPYQPEAAQGTLQAIYEFQSLITELTGLDISNASHYDGSTSMAEAALLALRHTDRTKILVARSVHPHYRQVLKTYLEGTHYEIEEFDFQPDKTFNRKDFSEKVKENVAGAIFQTPNFFGVVENLEGISEELHAQGALLIMVGHPLAMSVVKSPGEWGADVACGEGQPLGIPLQFGGPYLGYFSTTRALMRRIPGRLCGLTQDSDGKRAYVLTLQAREQHIRRERAASNICTNQALCALAACVYMTLLGKEGMREVGELNLDRANYLRQKISEIKGFTVDLKAPIFNEFVVKSQKTFAEIQKKLAPNKILPGIDLSIFYPQMENYFLICATETKTKEDLDHFVEALSQC